MNQLNSLLSKFGMGGSSQDEGKAASKHPDAEARVGDIIAACIPPACVIISFASTCPCPSDRFSSEWVRELCTDGLL